MLYNQDDFKGLRYVGAKAAETLDYITEYIQPGISTLDIDKLVAQHTKKQGGITAPLNYLGFPKHCCTSRNDIICHGIPNKNEYLQAGDIINIDVTTIINGYYGDTSRMFTVGEVSAKASKLIDTTYRSLMKAISICRPGVELSQIGKTIQPIAENEGFSVVRDFCGHGIGTQFHTPPNVLHYYDPTIKVTLQEGMVFTIEPMINTGSYEMYIEDNDWVARTIDGGLSAQFEHTIGITATGAEIFTASPAGFTKPPYKI